MPWLGTSFCRERNVARAVSGLLREDEAERGSGSALVSPSLGMFLLEKGSVPLSLAATTHSRFSIIVKQRTKQGNETVQFEFRIPQLLSSFTAYPSLHPLPSARSLTCSYPTNFTLRTTVLKMNNTSKEYRNIRIH